MDNLTRATELDVSGDFTVDFSAALKNGVNNEFYGNDVLLPNTRIVLIPKQAGGFMAIYLNGANERKVMRVALSDLTTDITPTALAASFSFSESDVQIEDLILERIPGHTAQALEVDVKRDQVSIFNTNLTIDIGQVKSTNATTPFVFLNARNEYFEQTETLSVEIVSGGGRGAVLHIFYRELTPSESIPV